MTIMVWNLQFFTEERVNNPDGPTAAARVNNMLTAGANRQYILSTVTRVDPSIFIVIEPGSQAGGVGTLATGGGPQGLLWLLLNGFRQSNAAWCMVPPLKTRNQNDDGRTYTETVGVYYRSDRLRFLGPYIWPAASPLVGPSVPPGPAAAAYPAPWNGTVPAGTTAAAQCQFFAGGVEITFPRPESRRPVLTTFQEIAAPNRVFKVFSCHTKPGTDAITATARMMGLAEAVPAANEISVFAGDFNVNFINANTVIRALRQYLMYNRRFIPTVGQPPEGVVPTMYERVDDATPLAYLRNLAVDNIWVRYGTGVRPAVVPVGVVVNRVVDRAAPRNIPYDMLDSLAEIIALPVATRDNTFREGVNFGHLGPPVDGTSDHLPVFVDL